MFCVLLFYIYTNIQINNYDNKYKEGIMESAFKIISYKDEKEYYDRYIAQNNSGDKFLMYIPRGEEIKKGTVIHITGEFKLPDMARNTGSFNYRRYLNSQKIFGSVYVEDFYVYELCKFD